MQFTSSRISSTSPYEFDLEILYKDRDCIGKSLYLFIGAVLRRGVPVNETASVWVRYSERVVWDDPDTNEWHTERVFDGLAFTDCATHPGVHAEKVGTLRFNTDAWASGPDYGIEGPDEL